MTIQVYFNNGQNASAPWVVGLHDGRCIVEQFGIYRNPLDAIEAAFATEIDAPIMCPEWLHIVLP